MKYGISLTWLIEVATIVVVVLKINGLITWSWMSIVMPFCIAVAAFALFFGVIFLHGKLSRKEVENG